MALLRLRAIGMALFFAVLACMQAPDLIARSGRDVGEWLTGKIFEGEGITIGFAEDGFFGMTISPQGKAAQNITGLWRLAPDGVELTLYTLQDSRLHMSVGKGALYALFGSEGHVALTPAQKDRATFLITGMLRKGARSMITDAGSGRDFEVNDDANAADGKFATAEIEIVNGEIARGHIIKHSGSVPRLLELRAQQASGRDFASDATCKFWLLPTRLWKESAALRFSRPTREKTASGESGSYEVSGPGLRVEGRYELSGEKLTMKPDAVSLRNLKILDAESLGRAVSGEFAWKLTSRGLELAGEQGRLLLLEP